MNEKDIIDAYCRIRKIDHTIPDDVLDFMKDAAIKQLNWINRPKKQRNRQSDNPLPLENTERGYHYDY